VAVLTARGISSLAVELLTRTMVLPMTVARVPGTDFAGDNGDTVTVRVPQPSTARTQATPGADITYDDVDEVPVNVTVSHLYHGKLVSAQELTYSLEDFGRQITRVQVTAVANGAENLIATAMNNLSVDATIDADGSDVEDVILEAREAMSRANVPLEDRFFAVSPELATYILRLENLSEVDKAGNSSALRDAVIGRYRGFTFVESSALTAGTGVAYHRSGFVFANFAPTTPRGVVDTSVTQSGGIALRQIFQYDPKKLSDASVVSTFAGAAPVAENGTGDDGTAFVRQFKVAVSAS